MCVIWPRISQLPVSCLFPNLRVLAVRTASNFVSAIIVFYANFTLNLSLTGLSLFDFFAIRMVSRSAIPHVEKLLFRLTHVFVLHLLRTQRSFAVLDRAELPHDDLSWLAAVKQRMIDQFSNMEMKLPKWLLWRWKLPILPFVTVRLRITNTGLEVGLTLLHFPYNEKRKLRNHENCMRP
jgi:hypothetical protein